MRWNSRKSRLKRWIEKHRHGSDFNKHVVLPLFPKKIGYYDGAPVFWLSPVCRVRKSSSWESKGFLDPGFTSWWDYDAPHVSIWSEWRETRPMHHLAGLVNFLIYWSWYPGILAGIIWFAWNGFSLL